MGLEVYALTKTLQAIESNPSSSDKEILVDILMSDIIDIGLQLVLSRLRPSTLKLIIEDAHLDPKEEQSQLELEEQIAAAGVRDYLLRVEHRIILAIIKDLGIETSQHDIMAMELGKIYLTLLALVDCNNTV